MNPSCLFQPLRPALCLLGAFGLFLLPAQAQTASAALRGMAWLVGDWAFETPKGLQYEAWRSLPNGDLTGRTYRIVNGDTTTTEAMELHALGKHLVFIAAPGRQTPTLFTLVKAENDAWTFENQEHDFPQRIGYSHQADGSLLAWIEGKLNGKPEREDYRMTRRRP
ncbi:MAG: hypothetical protein H7Y12_07625 [Sphingobacteriaceae bacterium]|nr:hypothetical protein [Cytophagaceae bacterium]